MPRSVVAHLVRNRDAPSPPTRARGETKGHGCVAGASAWVQPDQRAGPAAGFEENPTRQRSGERVVDGVGNRDRVRQARDSEPRPTSYRTRRPSGVLDRQMRDLDASGHPVVVSAAHPYRPAERHGFHMWRCMRRRGVTDGYSGDQQGKEKNLPKHLFFVPVLRALHKAESPERPLLDPASQVLPLLRS
jgi:hypothetical protein